MSILFKLLYDYCNNEDAQQMVVHCIFKHCQQKRLDPNVFVANEANNSTIAELVLNELPWWARKLIKIEEIFNFVVENKRYIQQHIYEASHQ